LKSSKNNHIKNLLEILFGAMLALFAETEKAAQKNEKSFYKT
jgi:hypothetical protein